MENELSESVKIRDITGRTALLRLLLGAMALFIIIALLHFMDQSAGLERKLKQSLYDPRNIYLKNSAGESSFIIGITQMGPRIALIDAQEKKRAELLAFESQAKLVIYDEVGQERAEISNNETGSLITLTNGVGESFELDLARLGPGFDLFKDYDGLKVGSLANNSGQVELLDSAGHVRVELRATQDLKQISIFDPGGRVKAQMIFKEQEPMIVLLDHLAKSRALIKMAEDSSLVEVMTGEAKKRMAFSLNAHGPSVTMFDDLEKPQEVLGLTTAGTSLDLFGTSFDLAESQPVVSAINPAELVTAPQVVEVNVKNGDQPIDSLFEPDAIIPKQEVATEIKTPLTAPSLTAP